MINLKVKKISFFIWLVIFIFLFCFLNFYQIYVVYKDIHKNIISNNLLLAYNDEQLNDFMISEVINELSDDVYPIGSIFMSTTISEASDVAAKFGGKWEVYSEGRTLIGASDDYPANSIGGNNTVELKEENLLIHSHTFTPSGTVESEFEGISVSTTPDGEHSHTVYGVSASGTKNSGIFLGVQTDGKLNLYHSSNGTLKSLWMTDTYGNRGTTYRSMQIGSDITTSTKPSHSHEVTAAGNVESTFTGTIKTTDNAGSGKKINVHNPYIAVYMFKRIG